MHFGIIGAGFAALIAANCLKQKGMKVSLFEKARGVSGRMSTRYVDQYEFDHGAQFITATNPVFKTFVDDMVKKGVLVEWHPRTGEFQEEGGFVKTTLEKKLFVATPRQNTLARYLADGLDIHIKTRIDGFEQNGDQWTLLDEEGTKHGPFDHIISSAPAPQTHKLFKDIFKDIDEVMNSNMLGAFSVMLGFQKPFETAFDMARPHNSLLSTITLNSSKPGRSQDVQCWVLQTENNWSEIHMEEDNDHLMEMIIQEAETLTGLEFSKADYKTLHRWRYAIAGQPLGKPYFIDQAQNLSICGDWCATNKVEGAFLSATQLIEEIAK